MYELNTNEATLESREMDRAGETAEMDAVALEQQEMDDFARQEMLGGRLIYNPDEQGDRGARLGEYRIFCDTRPTRSAYRIFAETD